MNLHTDMTIPAHAVNPADADPLFNGPRLRGTIVHLHTHQMQTMSLDFCDALAHRLGAVGVVGVVVAANLTDHSYGSVLISALHRQRSKFWTMMTGKTETPLAPVHRPAPRAVYAPTHLVR